MDNKSKLGYSKNSPYKDEPFININSNKITMKNTDKDLIGMGIKDGKVVKMLRMKSGNPDDYDFGDVDSVIEIPAFQKAGTYQLKHPGDIFPLNPNKPMPEGGFNPVFDEMIASTGLMNIPFSEEGIHQSNAWERVDATETPQQTQQTVQTTPQETAQATPQETVPDNQAMLDELEEVKHIGAETTQQKIANKDKPVGLNTPETDNTQNEVKAQPGTPNAEDRNDYNKTEEDESKTFNPYGGGIDLETAFAMFGRGLGEKDGRGMTAMYGAKAALGTARSLLGGMSAGQMSRRNEESMADDQKEVVRPFMQDGGFLNKEDLLEIRKFQNGGTQERMELSKKLTGNFTEGLANNNPEQAVAEAEDGEFILHNDGEIVEIQGNKHGRAGGEKLTSNQVQEGDRFISNHLKASKEIAKNLSKELGFKVTSKDTYASILRKYRKDLGLTNLIDEKQELIKGIEKTKKGKDNRTSQLNLQFQTDKLNKLQQKEEELKESFRGVANRVFEVQEASKTRKNTTDKMQDGGMLDMSSIKSLARKHGLSDEAAREVIKAFREGGEFDIPEYEHGGDHDKQKVTTKRGENPNPEADGKRQKYNDADLRLSGNVTKENLNQMLINLSEQFPNEVEANYDIVPDNGTVRWVPKDGVNSIKNLQQAINANYENALKQTEAIRDPEQRAKAQEAIKAEMFTDEGVRAIDGKFGDFTASREAFDIGVYDVKNVNMEMSDVGQFDSEKEKKELNIPILPDQSVMPPNAMAAHGKETIRLNRIEGNKVSPEQALAELGSQFDTAANQVNNRPDSARGAILAQMLAGTQGQANKAINQANMANQADANRVEIYNAQVGDKEMTANASERLRFEKMQMLAKENTDLDWRDYIDYNRRVQLNNYNTVKQMDMLNELFDKFEYVGGEVRQKSGTTDFGLSQAVNVTKGTQKGKNKKS
jgi:hypothetical protein